MSRPTQPIYLRTLRLRCALTQSDLGLLIGVSGNAVSKYERQIRQPQRNTLLALEIVFGVPYRDLFPALHDKVEEAVERRATKLDERTRDRFDAASLRKQGLLKQLSDRKFNQKTYEP